MYIDQVMPLKAGVLVIIEHHVFKQSLQALCSCHCYSCS